jgi:hypothetical protein
MIPERLIAAWSQVSGDAIASGWDIFNDPWGREEDPADDETTDADGGDCRQWIGLQDFLDL